MEINEEFTSCWPKDWLPFDLLREERLKSMTTPTTKDANISVERFRIIGINYESIYSLWSEDIVDENCLKVGIRDRALGILDELEAAKIGQRPTIWICHSMGGIIVKQILVHLANSQMNNKENSLLNNTKGIFFISTPHFGSMISSLLSRFSMFAYPTKEMNDLVTNSPYLVELNKQFINLLLSTNENNETNDQKLKYKLQTVCENLPTYLGNSYLHAMTVSEKSANIGYGDFQLINTKHHLNICKPDNRDCIVYNLIKKFVYDIMEEETKDCTVCKRVEHDLKMTAHYNFDFFYYVTFV
jgi:protein SERAC1